MKFLFWSITRGDLQSQSQSQFEPTSMSTGDQSDEAIERLEEAEQDIKELRTQVNRIERKLYRRLPLDKSEDRDIIDDNDWIKGIK